jgi:IS5 family transposase
LPPWFNLSDPAMEDALYNTPCFVNSRAWMQEKTSGPTKARLLDSAIDSMRSLRILTTVYTTLAVNGRLLKSGAVVDAMRIAAPSWTKNSRGERDPEKRQTKKATSGA